MKNSPIDTGQLNLDMNFFIFMEKNLLKVYSVHLCKQTFMNREMSNKIEDDVSLMAHEGSDEEQGKPDFVPEKHMDLTTKQGFKNNQSRKKAWQEMDESRYGVKVEQDCWYTAVNHEWYK